MGFVPELAGHCKIIVHGLREWPTDKLRINVVRNHGMKLGT